MKLREFTHGEEDFIVTAYADGVSVAQLSAVHATGWTQIARVLRAHGVYEGRTRSHRVQRQGEMCQRYAAGESLAKIGKAYGVSAAIVLKNLRRGGVVSRPARPPVPDYAERVRELREQGLGSKRIAKELGIGVTTAKKWIARYGLDGDPKTGPEGPHWRGGVAHHEGYRIVWLPKDDPLQSMAWRRGYVAEHRLVMARSLGRPLTRHETVHHINGDKTDNRLENLQLRSGQHGKGVRFTCLDCGSHNVAETPL